MGVSGLLKFVRKRFPRAVSGVDLSMGTLPLQYGRQTNGTPPYDHLLVDLNNILHMHMRKRTFYARGTQDLSPMGKRYKKAIDDSFSMDHFLRGFVYRDINSLVQEFAPQRSVFLAMDGPGPLAKLKHQRRSRLKNNAENINKLRITPGTTFMKELQTRIPMEYRPYRDHRTQTQDSKQLELSVSGSDVPGEGELKLFQFVQQQEQKSAGLGGKTTGKCVISTSDMDMMVFNCLNPLRERVDLHFRGSSHSDGGLLDSSKMLEHFSQLAGSDAERVSMDLGFLILLMGNDYFPCIPRQMVERSWRLYQGARTTSPKRFILGHSSTDSNGRRFIDLDMELLLDCLTDGNGGHQRKPSNDPKFSFKLQECLQQNNNADLDRNRVIDALSTLVNDPIPTMVVSFMKCVLWNTDMYLNARVDDYHMVYPFDIAPSKSQIRNVYHAFGHDRFMEAIQPRNHHSEPLTEDVFCLSVMPPTGRVFVPKHLQPMFDELSTMEDDVSDGALSIVSRVQEALNTWGREKIQAVSQSI